MKKHILRVAAWSLLAVALQGVCVAQESVSKAQEQVARTQEAAARNQETSARLAADAANEPSSLTLLQDATTRAREAANRAQQAANRAQDAADRDAASSEAQAAATRAQEYANRALEAANRTQEMLNTMRRTSMASRGGGAAPPIASASLERVTANGNGSTDGSSSTDTEERSAPQRARSMSPSISTTSMPVGGLPGGAVGANTAASGIVTNAAEGAGDSTSGTGGTVSQSQGSTAGNKPALSTEAKNYSDYLNVRTEELAIASLGPKNNTNQNETPSISTNSTSLVEKSSVGDLLTLAFNPAGTSGGSASGDATSTSVSITGYALKAFLSGNDPLDPAFYTANRNWRKFSFTYGYDFPEGSEGNPRERGNIYGVKFIPYDRRDVSHPSNRQAIRDISAGLQRTGVSFANLVSEVRRYIYTRLKSRNQLPAVVAAEANERDQLLKLDEFLNDKGYAGLVALIGKDGLKEIDTIISKRTEFAEFDKETEEIINRIRRRPQVSMFFLTKQRQLMRADEYDGGLSLDLGVAERWNLTFNGAFNYTDNKLADDNRGGRFGTELLIPITAMNRLADRAPATFSFAASGEWKTKVAPMYQGQAKLTIPVPFLPGLQMPISVSFASRSELIKESDVRGRIGFTFDMARLLSGLRSKFLANAPIPIP
ncbi:MAG TPA: hypothetical protein VGW12_08800 [Pyrinomonadaceae bacterium]|nr:hypothetical protein [Pyrinomonadaceae bacterium]